ncbi:NAD(P)H-dependent oxidoreductase [Micromonospora sp. WMMD1082]|uniref:NAD(P)H-dependent oxidoreductase n=1 Tax=Micromonospora sp. WMMD1082 TaxID=3016104 RepID=UPI0024161B6E|nr:NAD(P)H-dependent oxidoreductase [Micromonospora sp. WMMD1082]MDG4797923.1 NAD(P)H-dependent oxidoreductase [Micromonospora sp. WMMD1082]
MTTSPAVVELIGNPRSGSRTRALADAAADELSTRAGGRLVGRQVLELADAVGVTFGPEPAVAAGPVDDPFALVRAARLLIVATPTYKATYTGLLKLFLDRFGHLELAGVVAVPVAVAASEAHRRSVGAALTDLLAELGASVPAPPLAVLEAQAADPTTAAAEWASRHGTTVVETLIKAA